LHQWLRLAADDALTALPGRAGAACFCFVDDPEELLALFDYFDE
jgi:hypothetical protein